MIPIIKLGMHPYADTFVSADQLHLSEPVYPLELELDTDTGLIQTVYKTEDYKRYNEYAYSYTSANSEYSRHHWKEFFEFCNEVVPGTDRCVIEIGSNDGFLLRMFDLNDDVAIGIDASKEMCTVARQQGSDVDHGLFSSKFKFTSLQPPADLIIANNVFNHANDPYDFVEGIKNWLHPNGVFVFEVPYWMDTVVSNRFDQIYHEHVSYFTIKSLNHILRYAGLEILTIHHNQYHGGSLRVVAGINKDSRSELPSVSRYIHEESVCGLFDPNFYINEWQPRLVQRRNQFLEKLYKIKNDFPNIPIIAVGAAAKANTFLNYYNLNNTVIDYITDSSPYKRGKYTPLTRIPIVDDDIFATFPDVYALIVSWNISDQLIESLSKINSNIKFIPNE